jgi:acyl carrier protein
MEEILAILEDLRPEFDFKESENFIDDGYLDSFDILTLISEIEEKYNISIDGLDVVPENFETVETIANLIKKSGGEIESK